MSWKVNWYFHCWVCQLFFFPLLKKINSPFCQTEKKTIVTIWTGKVYLMNRKMGKNSCPKSGKKHPTWQNEDSFICATPLPNGFRGDSIVGFNSSSDRDLGIPQIVIAKVWAFEGNFFLICWCRCWRQFILIHFNLLQHNLRILTTVEIALFHPNKWFSILKNKDCCCYEK